MNTQMQYHNPENVPADKVPKGWRFLTMEEQRHRARLGADAPMGCRYWFPDMDEFSINSNGTGATRDWTYIIPDTQPEPAPSPWIAFSERKPTDAEMPVFYACMEEGRICGAMTRTPSNIHSSYTHWMPIPPLPVERKKTQEEIQREEDEAAYKQFHDEQLPHSFSCKTAFLAGLRHARAQGKEGV